MTLDEIAIKNGTDKATKHPRYGHSYTPHYAKFFDPIRNDPIKFLEIGVGGGESIMTWLDFFPNAMVYGVDIVKDTNPWNTVGATTHERYTFICGSQSDPTFWKCFRADYGGDWDVVMDDGGHFSDQIIISFNGLWEHLKAGGLYCIEDCGVVYGDGSVFLTKGWKSQVEFIKDKIDDINLTKNQVASMYCSNELAIIQKSK